MGLFTTIRSWLWEGAEPFLVRVAEDGENIGNELAELKKLVRRQGIQQESLVREISTKLDTISIESEAEPRNGRPEALIELAESYFHLENALRLAGYSRDTLEALDIVWDKLEQVCKESDLDIIRDVGCTFDSRLHESLDRAPAGGEPVVGSVTAPGFIYNGQVIRPARVMLSEKAVKSEVAEGEETYGE
jgi:molecular chaperone GrpE (heat shock protein)